MKALLNFFKPASRGEYNLIEQKKGGVLKNISSFIKKLLGIQKRPDVAILKRYTPFENMSGSGKVFSNLVSVRAKDEGNQSKPGFRGEESVIDFTVRGQGIPTAFNELYRDKVTVEEDLSLSDMKKTGGNDLCAHSNDTRQAEQPESRKNNLINEIKEGVIEKNTQKPSVVGNSALDENQGVKDEVIKTLREIEDKHKKLVSELNDYLAKNNNELRDDENKFYYFDKSNNRLVDKLDDMYDDVGNNEELRVMRKDVYKKLFPFSEKLDDIAKATREKDKKRPG